MTGARQDVVCKIFGENLDTLALMPTNLAAIISTVKGDEKFICGTSYRYAANGDRI